MAGKRREGLQRLHGSAWAQKLFLCYGTLEPDFRDCKEEQINGAPAFKEPLRLNAGAVVYEKDLRALLQDINQLLPRKHIQQHQGTHSAHTSFSPARKPDLIRSYFAAPRFCAVKFEMPLPSVVKDVITMLFSLTAAEYPAMTAAPKPLITLWITILPTEIKLYCKMLGTATTAKLAK